MRIWLARIPSLIISLTNGTLWFFSLCFIVSAVSLSHALVIYAFLLWQQIEGNRIASSPVSMIPLSQDRLEKAVISFLSSIILEDKPLTIGSRSLHSSEFPFLYCRCPCISSSFLSSQRRVDLFFHFYPSSLHRKNICQELVLPSSTSHSQIPSARRTISVNPRGRPILSTFLTGHQISNWTLSLLSLQAFMWKWSNLALTFLYICLHFGTNLHVWHAKKCHMYIRAVSCKNYLMPFR